MMNKDEILEHYGTPRHSGRYPWGSGTDPQRSHDFLSKVDGMRRKGMKDVDIASSLGITTTEMRSHIATANEDRKKNLIETTKHMREDGKTFGEIAERLGVSVNSVRAYSEMNLDADKVKAKQISNIKGAVIDGVAKTGYLDVGPGIAQQLGISSDKLQKTVKALEAEGYHTHDVYVQRLTDPSKYTTVHVLTKEKDIDIVKKHKADIATLEERTSDGGTTLKKLKVPESLSMDKVSIKYGDQGGEDRDGLIQIRPGAKGLDLGAAKYAQVRIKIGDGLYAKGMAVIDPDAKFPAGKDIIFNTNKSKIDPITGIRTRDDKVFKKIKDDSGDPMKMFGTTITDQKGKLNIASQEGDWSKWHSTLSSQFLSKQPVSLIRERLEATHSALKKQFDDAMAIDNPVLRKSLLDGIVSDADAKQVHLKAKGLPKSQSHVLLPFPEINPGQVYAPNYNDGDRVVLVRYPHGGTFELPELTVNNKLKRPKAIMKNATDAIGIHPSVAHKLSGADFDGDTVMVIPNNSRKVKTSDSLKGLRNFDPNMYEVDHATISPRQKQTQMGKVSNLITDMTIKGATTEELTRAVKHSMVVIDSEKHKLDWRKSAVDNGIRALQKKYQTRVGLTGKEDVGASTIVSRSKQTIATKTREYIDPVTGKKKTKVLQETPYINTIKDARVLTSKPGTKVESEYAGYVNRLKTISNEAAKASMATPSFRRNPLAAKKYATQVESLRAKVKEAMANAPRERQAQVQAEQLFRERNNEELSKDARKKLKSQVLSEARINSSAKRSVVQVTPEEWKAIDNEAVSANLLSNIIRYGEVDKLAAMARPERKRMSTERIAKAKALLRKGYTPAEVANSLGINVVTLKREVM